MKKILNISLALVLSLGLTYGQKDSTAKSIEIQIEESTLLRLESTNFNSLSAAELGQLIAQGTKEIMALQKTQRGIEAKIDRLEAEGKISPEEAEALREKLYERVGEGMERIGQMMEEWGGQFEEASEDWAEELAEALEDWAEELEAESSPPPVPPVPSPPATEGEPADSSRKRVAREGGRIVFDGEELLIRFGKGEDDDEENALAPWVNKKSKSIPRSYRYFDLNFGFNQVLEDGQFLIEDIPGELRFWQSIAFALGLGAKTRLGSLESKTYLKYGLEVSWHNFRLRGDEVLTTSEGNFASFVELPEVQSFNKNKYHVAYLNLPLMLQWDFSQAGRTQESWTLGLGGYAGVRINGKRELEYQSVDFRRIREKVNDDFYFNRFRYGLQFQVGYEDFVVTAAYDLNPFFRPDRGPSYNMATVAFGFSW